MGHELVARQLQTTFKMQSACSISHSIVFSNSYSNINEISACGLLEGSQALKPKDTRRTTDDLIRSTWDIAGCSNLNLYADESKWFQVSPSESKWVQVKWIQVNPSESKWFQVSPSESKWVQVSPSESKWIQVSPSESKWVQVSPSDSKWLQVSPSESKWVQVNPSESKWDHQVSPPPPPNPPIQL